MKKTLLLLSFISLLAGSAYAQSTAPFNPSGQSMVNRGTAPPSPPSGKTKFYFNASGQLSTVNSSGTVSVVGGAANALTYGVSPLTSGAIPVAGTSPALVDSILNQGTNLIEQRNGTNAQTFRVYGSGSAYANVSSDATNAYFASSGTGYGMAVRHSDGLILFNINGTSRWGISATDAGLFFPAADATYSIGLPSNQIKDLYLGRWVVSREVSANPVAGDLSAIGGSTGQAAWYIKANNFVIAYNVAGTVNYLSIPLDGSTTTWANSSIPP